MDTHIEHMESLVEHESAKEIETESKPKPRYSFPISNVELEKIEKYVPTRNLEKTLEMVRLLSFGNNDDHEKPKPYTEIRNQLCVYGMILNLQGKIAPRFRQMRKPCPALHKFDYPIDHTLLSNDRQVIDLHWIYCQGLRANTIMGYGGLFDRHKPFNFELASALVEKAGAKKRKSSLLGLSEFEEFQLASIESEKVKTRWKTIRQYSEKNHTAIKGLYDKPKSKIPEERYTELPLIHLALLISRASASKGAEMYSLMTNKELDVKSFQRYAKKMKDNGYLI